MTNENNLLHKILDNEQSITIIDNELKQLRIKCHLRQFVNELISPGSYIILYNVILELNNNGRELFSNKFTSIILD